MILGRRGAILLLMQNLVLLLIPAAGTRIRLIAIFAVLVCCTVSARAGVDRFTNISPEGAEILALAVDPLQPSTVYAGSTAGVFKSIDAGESWALFLDTGTVAKGSTEGGRITSLAIDPTHASTVYAGTETGEVFKTLDGGASWTRSYVMVKTGPTSGFSSMIKSLIVDPFNPNILYALQSPAVMVSVDGGLSWTAKMTLSLDTNSSGSSLAFDPSTPSRVYAGTRSGLYVSNDRGQQWQLLRQGGVWAVAVDPKDPAVLYTAQGSFLSSTRDGGKTWDDVPLGVKTPGVAVVGLRIVVDPMSSSAYALTSATTPGGVGGILTTSDRGKTWAPLPPPPLNPSLLVIGPTPTHGFYASDGIDLFKSENGGTTWRRLHKGLNAPRTFDVAVDPKEPSTLYAATSKGVVKSADAGSNWSDQKVSLSDARLAIDPNQSSRVFAFTDSSTVRSTDGGETWTAVDPGPRVRAMAIDPSNSANVYAILINGLSRSTDGGSAWTPITNVQLPLGYYGFLGGAIAVDPVTPTTIYAGGDGGIMKSMDAGVTWETIFKDSSNSWWMSFGFRRILIDPRSPSTVYALGWDKVYRSGNAGQSWSIVYAPPSPPAYLYLVDLELDPREPSRLYLATNSGLLRSLYSGNQWTEFNEGLPTRRIDSLTVGAEGNVYVATPRGLFVNSPHDEAVSPSPLSVSLRTHSGNYVSAAGCGFSFVHANASDAGRCEAFSLFDINGGELKDGDTILLQAAGGGFVVAEGGGSVSADPSPVNANRVVPRAWETFVIHRQSGSRPIQSGDSIALQSVSGGYIAAEGGGRSGCQCDSRLNANRAEVREWETFVLIFN